jgi:hypothetical protein
MQRLCEVVDAGIAALQRADADALWDLTRRAHFAVAPTTVPDRQATADQLLVFRHFLRLTRRNLLLLRAACRQRDTYEATEN